MGALRTAEAEREARRLDAVLSPEWSAEESPAAETDWVRTALRRPMDPVPRFVVRASSSGPTDLEREALRGWRHYTAGLWRDYTAELGVPAGAPETLPWQSEEEPEPVSLRPLHRWTQVARRSRWPLLREVVAETIRAAVEPESIDRLPLPPGRESVFELLCVVLPRRFDALVTFDKPRAGFHGILLEAKSGAQSFADTVHQLKAYRSALRDSLPGPLLVWGVVEGGGDRVKAFDGPMLFEAALERTEEDDFWLFTSEAEIREALQALGLSMPGSFSPHSGPSSS